MKTSTQEQRAAMMDFIVSVEARRGKDGKLRVYPLPAADGGGAYEVAGINDRYHPAMAAHLKHCLEQGWFERAEADIRAFLLDYTNVVMRWTEVPAIEAFLRDCAFNRGPRGALRILQLALGVADDGKWGPKTKGALEASLTHPHRVRNLLVNLRRAREGYERRVAPPVGKRAPFWKGLVSRWDKTHTFAAAFLQDA